MESYHAEALGESDSPGEGEQQVVSRTLENG
jgi:hypothetical protein